MREILFRGFHECENGTQKAYYGGEWHKGEWVYGYYVPFCLGHFPCAPCIVPEPDGTWEPIEVAPETVCQYTGLKDKNDKKIFENDILKVYQYGDGFGTYFDPPKDTKQNVLVYWDLCAWSWKNTDDRHYWIFPSAWVHYKGEVIGNKFENPDLVEVEE